MLNPVPALSPYRRPPLRAPLQAILLALSIAAITEGAGAYQGPPLTLESMAKAADVAFAGTVDSFTYRRDGNFVLTDVHFSKVKHAGAGPSGGDLTLSIWGGSDGGSQIIIGEMPRFEVGKRYVVLAVDHGSRTNWYIPIIGMNDGFFQVMADSRRNVPIIQDWAGRPLIRLEGGHIVVLANNSRSDGHEKPEVDKVPGLRMGGGRAVEPGLEIVPTELDPGTRVTESEFLAAVQHLRGR